MEVFEFIIAPCDFDFGGPASTAAQNAGVVGMSLCASDPLYSSWSLGDKQFTLSMWNTTMSATAAEFAYNEMGWKTAYVVTDQIIAYTRSLSEYFLVHFDAIGGKILLEDTLRNINQSLIHKVPKENKDIVTLEEGLEGLEIDQEDDFDKITVSRNMKELKGYSDQFKKLF